jgi:hypothetical protein
MADPVTPVFLSKESVMKRMMSIAGAMVLCASQVSALSCMRPDVARTFQSAATAEESYIVLLGQFSFTAPPRRGLMDNNAQPVSVPAQFEGSYLGADGFVAAPTLDVTMTFTCAGPWCGSMNGGSEQVLAFVQQTSAGYSLEVGPCQDKVFSEPDSMAVQQVEGCMRGETCEESPLR